MKLRLIDPERLIPDAHVAAEASVRGKVEDYDTPVSDTTQQAATAPLSAPATPPHMLD